MTPFGDRALRFDVSGDPRTRRALSDALRAVPGVLDVVVAEEQACIVLDEGADARALEHTVASLRVDASVVEPQSHVIDVVYDGEDLDAIARATRLTRGQVIEAHAAASYAVSMVGFMPGFAYLRGLDERLVLPRRASPRLRVPPRSVAMAAKYTGIYPSASPGGWHLLGRAPAFEPFSLALGDRVRFQPVPAVPEAPVPSVEGKRPFEPPGRYVEVVSVQGFAHVVEAARPGRMHEGVPHGGPLVASAFARASGGASALEIYGKVTLDLGGDTFTVGTDAGDRVVYVGAEGGLLPLGPVRRGDRLSTLARTRSSIAVVAPATTKEPIAIAIALGPDPVLPAVIDALLGATFRVAAASNRVGTRLEGPPLIDPTACTDRASAPMVKGAIELTPSGLVVLGPDHPTTGGYPVVGVLRSRSMDAFFARPPFADVRFVAG